MSLSPLTHLPFTERRQHNYDYDNFRWYHFLKWPHSSHDITYFLFLIRFQNMTWILSLKGNLKSNQNMFYCIWSVFLSIAFMFKETNWRKRLLWVMLPEDSHQPWQGGLIEHSHVVEVERWKITSSTPVTKEEERIKMAWIYLFFFLIANPQCHTLFSNVPTTKFLKTLWPTEDPILKDKSIIQ